MNYLIDTQIFIWSIISPEKLSKNTQNILQENPILVSQISFYEITIKQKIGKLSELSLPIDNLIKQALKDGFQILPLKNEHIASYNSIPFFSEHKDPFDRIILAISLSEKMPIISADANFKLYASQIQLIEN